MALGDTAFDVPLQQAWHRYCDNLKRAGDQLFRDPIRASPEIRAESFRYLTQAVAQGFDWHIENQMPMHPFLMRMFGPTRKQAGDKSMSMEYGCYIDGSQNYRVYGDRGTSKWIVATALRRPQDEPAWNEPWALVLDAPPLLQPDFEIGDDGSLELWVGPDKHEGNWLQTTPDTVHLRIRQLFDDWEHEEPMTLRIERVGGEPGSATPPALLHPDELIGMLEGAATFAYKSVTAWGPSDRLPVGDNEFYFRPQTDPVLGTIDANPGGVMAMAWWVLEPDEAMIIQYEPVPDFFWTWELENVWWQTPDYRWRLVTLTPSLAALEDDGSLVIVVSGSDPGVPNWLDTAGYREGFVRFRSLLPDGRREPEFRNRVVRLADLDKELPVGAKRIDQAGRQEQLRSRAAGIDKRFRV